MNENMQTGAQNALNRFLSRFDADEVRYFIDLVRSAVRAINDGFEYEPIRDDFLKLSSGHSVNLRKYINFHLFSKHRGESVATAFKGELLAIENELCDLLNNGSELVQPVIPKVRKKTQDVLTLPHTAHLLAWERTCYAAMDKEARTYANYDNSFRIEVLGNFASRCAVSGSGRDVTAAHIIPKSLTGSNDPANGIALTHFLHLAYDAYIFAIEPLSLRLVVAPAWRHVLAFDGQPLINPRNSPLSLASLDFGYQMFCEVNRLSL